MVQTIPHPRCVYFDQRVKKHKDGRGSGGWRLTLIVELTNVTMKQNFFVVTILLIAFLDIACTPRPLNCASVKRGRFLYYSSALNKKYFIERNDSIQIEVDSSSKTTVKSKIVWVNDCAFDLTIMLDSNKRNDGIDSFFASTPIKTTIIKVTPTYYVFSSSIDNAGKRLVLVDTTRILSP